MPKTPSRSPALLGAVAFAVVSWSLAAAYVAAHRGFGSGDLPGFAFWSVLLALPAYAVLRVFDRRSTAWRPAPTYLAAAALGTLAGVASTLLVALILGGWIGAFSFPVFLCWLAGSLVAFVAVTLLRRPTSWLFALPAVALPIVGVVVILRIVLAQPPDLLIHIKPETSAQQIETIWTDVLGTPHPSGRGHSHIEGVGAVSRFDSDTEARIRVSFQPGTSSERRAEVVQRVLASPLVARTSDLEPSSGVEFRGSAMLPSEPE
jgi:hypothetical protein